MRNKIFSHSFLILFLLFLPLISFSQGSLLVVGGGTESNDYPESWSTQAYSWAVQQAPNKKVAVIHYDNTGNWLKPYFTEHCGAEASENFVIDQNNANDQELMDSLMQYDMFFFRGGDQYHYYTDYNGTLMEETMNKKFDEGGVLAGTSAGLAILSGVIFWAQNGSAYSDETLKNIYDANITLADDFIDALPGFIFDSHFVDRGRTGRLVAFMANYEKETDNRIIGVGVDETTALGITAEKTGIAFGTRAVSFYKLPEDENFGNGPALSARNLEVQQIVHGDSINLETLKIKGLPESIAPQRSGENAAETILMSGSEEFSSANISLLEDLSGRIDKENDNILIISGASFTFAEEIQQWLEQAGIADVSKGHAIYDYRNNAILQNDIEEADVFIFVDNSSYNFNVFLNSEGNGPLLREKLKEAGKIKVFIGDNSKLAGPVLVNNYRSGRSNLSLADGLGFLKTTCIIPGTFDPPGGSTDSWYSTHIAVPFAMINAKLNYGIWLNNDNYLVYETAGNQSRFTAHGSSPVMVMEMNEGRAGFTEMTYNGQPSETPEQIAGFNNMRLSFLADGESIVAGSSVSVKPFLRKDKAEILLFPNPAKDYLNIKTGMNIQHLKIIDAQGKILQQFNPNDNLRGISTASLQPGVFLLEINDGRNRYYRQFLKEK